MADAVNHPIHYGGEDNPYEAIKVIEAWGLGFNLGNTTKYISRAGFKDPAKELEDLKKARWYLDREITNREKVQSELAAQANQTGIKPAPAERPLVTLSEEPQHEDFTDGRTLSNYHGTVATAVAGSVQADQEPKE